MRATHHTPALKHRARHLALDDAAAGLFSLLQDHLLSATAAQALVRELERDLEPPGRRECIIALVRTTSAVLSHPSVAIKWFGMLQSPSLSPLLSAPTACALSPHDELISHLDHARWSPRYRLCTTELIHALIMAEPDVLTRLPLAQAWARMNKKDATSLITNMLSVSPQNARVLNAHVPGCVAGTVRTVAQSLLPRPKVSPNKQALAQSLLKNVSDAIDVPDAALLQVLQQVHQAYTPDQSPDPRLEAHWTKMALTQSVESSAPGPSAHRM